MNDVIASTGVARGPMSRRELLSRCGIGAGMLGFASLLQEDAAAAAIDPLAPRPPHFPAKARQVVHLFMNGGPSQVDTFDPKPLLDKYHGKPLPSASLRTERKTAGALRSPFKFQRHGKSGIEVSELFPRTAECIDDMV